MKITIFKDIQDKENAQKAILGTTTILYSYDDLSNYISNYAWSPSIFKGKRCNNNFIQISAIVLDIDNGINIEQAKVLIKNLRYDCVLATTLNHQKEKNGVICDRYRIVFKLKTPILNKKDFLTTWLWIGNKFKADRACKDVARFYFKSPVIRTYIFDQSIPILKFNGEQELPVIKNKQQVKGELGQLSSRTLNFLKGEMKDSWHLEFLIAGRDIKAQGYNFEEAYKLLQGITGHLDTTHDVPQLNYIYYNNDIEFDYRIKKE